MALTIGHVGLVVDDLDCMLDFYTRVVGLAERRRAVIEGPHIDGLTGLSDVKLEAIFLGTPRHPEALEMLKYHHHPSPNILKGPSAEGFNHLQFVVESLAPVVDGLRAEKLEFWGEPRDWPGIWRRVLYAKDPEGNVIEFNERRSDVEYAWLEP